MADPLKTDLYLGSVQFDLSRETLLDPAGLDIALRPQSMAVLKALAENPGQLLDRDDLIAAVWGDVSVTDDSLIQCIADIRKAIGDSRHKIIQTVPKKGYKLVPNTSQTPRPRVWRSRSPVAVAVFTAILIAVAVFWLAVRPALMADPPSIAVLPFKNLSGDPDQTPFADAMTKAITANISKFDGLFVVSSYSAFRYRDTDKSVSQIVSELNVRYLFVGEVLPGLDQLKVSAQLIDGDTGQTVWTEQFDVANHDVFLIQEDLSARLATTLVAQVEVATERLSWQRARANLNAYELLLQADPPKIERQSLNEGIALLQNVVELDPKFSRAFALIGHYYLHLWRHSLAQDLDLALGQARKWAADALSLNDLSYEAYKTLATIQLYADEDHAAAYESLSRALQINPNHADIMVQMATLLTFMDRDDEANQWIEKAYHHNPFYPAWYDWNASFVYTVTGQYDRGNSTAKKALAVYDSSASLRRILIYGFGMLNDWDTAGRYAREILERTPDFRLSTHMRNSPFQNLERKRHVFTILNKAGLPH